MPDSNSRYVARGIKAASSPTRCTWHPEFEETHKAPTARSLVALMGSDQTQAAQGKGEDLDDHTAANSRSVASSHALV